MDLTVVITAGETDFPLATPTVQEVRNVKRWTGFASKQEWFSAVLREDADAILAAYVIAKRRTGAQISFDDTTDFPADVVARWTDGAGNTVEPAIQMNDDGTVRLDGSGNVIPVLDEEGRQVWRDAESKNVIPFEKPSRTSTTTPSTPTPSSDTATGTPNTETG